MKGIKCVTDWLFRRKTNDINVDKKNQGFRNKVCIMDLDIDAAASTTTTPVTTTTDEVGTYQRYEVESGTTHVVQVTVVRARNLRRSKQTNQQSSSNSNGAASRFVLKTKLLDKAESWLGDVPDCYLTLKIPDTPNGLMRTQTMNNQQNPEWNETFSFYFNASSLSIIEIDLLDANYLKDEIIGSQVYPLDGLPMDQHVNVTLGFPGKENMELELVFHRSIDDRVPQLRYSIELCNEEKEFLKARKQHIFQGLRNILNEEDSPKTEHEVPIVALLGSGGGFRAMVGFSGAIQALTDSGIFDCTTYAAGLSGSTWYLSWLYSHPEYPVKSASELQPHLQKRIGQCPFHSLNPQRLYNYMGTIKSKRRSGQPVSFTDLFGLMVGNTLLNDRLDAKLSDQKSKVAKGEVPLPLYTCIHVKKQVQARVYHEWLEFSPFEVGFPKYGTFMRSEHFGSIFYMGRLTKSFPECPIHYLQGIWGSAFAILFKQLLWIVKTDASGTLTYINPGLDDAKSEEEIDSFRVQDEDDTDVDCDNDRAVPQGISNEPTNTDSMPTTRGFFGDMKTEVSNIWNEAVDTVASMDILNTLTGRAASIFNPLRGSEFGPLFSGDIHVTNIADDENLKGLKEPMSAHNSTVYLVDGGLGFNSPYAILLRPQRGVQLYISYDFSARPTDSTPPFKELLLAEQWAHKTGVPFPPISKLADDFMKSPLRECYIFRDDTIPRCPIIMHFVLINLRFKEFMSPGVPRTTPEEKKFADFSIFDGPTKPFSTFNFEYPPEQFSQLTGLTAFNTLCEVETIKDILKELVTQNRSTQKMKPKIPT